MRLAAKHGWRFVGVGSLLLTGQPAWSESPSASGGSDSIAVEKHVEPAVATNARAESDLTVDSALAALDVSLRRLESVFDYRCRIVRETWQGPTTTQTEDILAKFRVHPASVYLRWSEPIDGQELIFAEGKNGNRVLTHGARVFAGTDPIKDRLEPIRTSCLPANGPEAIALGMRGQLLRVRQRWLYEKSLSITRLVRVGEGSLNGQACFVVNVSYPHADDGRFRFHTTRVYIDRSTTLPARIEEWGYPEAVGEQPGRLLDAISYLDVRLNVGLSEEDFSIAHADYGFSKF